MFITLTETPEVTQARLKQYMQAEAYRVNPDMPLFEQSAVQSKILFTCISAVMPIMSIYRLPLGQYEYAGHVINLSQDVVVICTISFSRVGCVACPMALASP